MTDACRVVRFSNESVESRNLWQMVEVTIPSEQGQIFLHDKRRDPDVICGNGSSSSSAFRLRALSICGGTCLRAIRPQAGLTTPWSFAANWLVTEPEWVTF